eukprot:sb/3477239/
MRTAINSKNKGHKSKRVIKVKKYCQISKNFRGAPPPRPHRGCRPRPRTVGTARGRSQKLVRRVDRLVDRSTIVMVGGRMAPCLSLSLPNSFPYCSLRLRVLREYTALSLK